MRTDCWPETTLSQAAGSSAVRSGPFGSQLHSSDYVSEGIPVMMPRDFAGGSINTGALARVSPEKAAELARFQVRAGDVLLARRGEMGRCTRIERWQDGWLCGTGVLRIRPNSHLDGDFLIDFLRWQRTVAWLRDHAVGQTLPSLNARTVASLPIQLPPIGEQRMISAILGAARSVIGASSRIVGQIRKVRDGFWRQLLTEGPRRCPGFGGGRFDPRDWPSRSIGSLCTTSNGYPFKTTDRSAAGLPIIRIRNLNGSRAFRHFAGRPAPEWTVEVGDLLFAWAGVKGSSFGPCLWPGPRGVLNQHIFRVRPDEGVAKEWLFEALKLATRSIEEKARGFKNDLLHARKRDLTEQMVPVPPFDVQLRIADQSRALNLLETTELAALARLIRLEKSIAQDLLSRRVRVGRR